MVWRRALGELKWDEWMIRIRSADDLTFALALMLGARGKIPVGPKEELPDGEGCITAS